MAQDYLKITGNVHLGDVLIKKDGVIDWEIMGISTVKMKTKCRQGHKKVDTSLGDDYRQYLPIKDKTNPHILKIIASINADDESGNTAEIVTEDVYNIKKSELDAARVARKTLSKK